MGTFTPVYETYSTSPAVAVSMQDKTDGRELTKFAISTCAG